MHALQMLKKVINLYLTFFNKGSFVGDVLLTRQLIYRLLKR